MNRRDFLKIACASSMVNFFGFHPGALAFGNGNDAGNGKKLIVILLRGGVDGLNVVAPYGDNRYSSLRPTIALSKSEAAPLLDLDGYWGMHPAMSPLMSAWQDKTLAFVHDCGSPDPTRSHFDAQDYMESGVPGKKSVTTGWINRLVGQLPSKHTPLQAISVGPVLPRICSGPTTIASVSRQISKTKSVMDRPYIAKAFDDLYGGLTDDLGRAFVEGVAAHTAINEVMDSPDVTGNDQMSMQGGGRHGGAGGADDAMSREQKIANAGAPTPKTYNKFGTQLANLFRKDPTVQVAFADFGGWDTHIRQGAGKGQLAQHLSPLAQGLGDLIAGLGPLYKDTTILVMSEFGRTAKENGNGGTDHGHGNVMWLLGGEIPGGKVYGKWGGLDTNGLHEDRDLPASTDFRTVISTVLGNHMNISKAGQNIIFPDFAYPGSPFV